MSIGRKCIRQGPLLNNFLLHGLPVIPFKHHNALQSKNSSLGTSKIHYFKEISIFTSVLWGSWDTLNHKMSIKCGHLRLSYSWGKKTFKHILSSKK